MAERVDVQTALPSLRMTAVEDLARLERTGRNGDQVHRADRYRGEVDHRERYVHPRGLEAQRVAAELDNLRLGDGHGRRYSCRCGHEESDSKALRFHGGLSLIHAWELPMNAADERRKPVVEFTPYVPPHVAHLGGCRKRAGCC